MQDMKEEFGKAIEVALTMPQHLLWGRRWLLNIPYSMGMKGPCSLPDSERQASWRALKENFFRFPSHICPFTIMIIHKAKGQEERFHFQLMPGLCPQKFPLFLKIAVGHDGFLRSSCYIL
jgi:hypothetical protein